MNHTNHRPDGTQDQRGSVLPQSDHVINEMAESSEADNVLEATYTNQQDISSSLVEEADKSDELYQNVKSATPAYVSTGFEV